VNKYLQKLKVMFKFRFSLFIVLSLLLLHCTSSQGNNKSDSKPEVKNVILLIGDGMGIGQVYSGITANKGLNMEKAQFVGLAKTYSASDYITDSAAGGTALATGTKTYNGAIGVDENGNEVKSILEHAAENGLSTGVVASCAITHATPASFVAHQLQRSMQEEIAVDFVNSDVTLFIGGGRKYFDARSDDKNLLPELEAKGFKVALDMESVMNTENGKLAALIADEHPTAYPERGEFLPESVGKALDLLKDNKEGFFLIVEGSQIDWASHANEAKNTINEVIDFDNAVKIAFDFADQNPGTLVVITADHETGAMSITGGDLSTGEVNASWGSTGHSAIMVPVFSYGTAAIEFAGIYENTDIFKKILELYNF
jgi:alkaline phosphatase